MLENSDAPVTASPLPTVRSDAKGNSSFRFPAGLTLRQRRCEDGNALLALLSQPDFQRNGSTLDPFSSIDELEGVILGTGPGNCELVATIRDAIVGFAGLYVLRGRQKHVGSFTLTVHEQFQKMGIGTTLMHAVLETGFRLMNLQRIQATVFTDNVRACSLYRSFGFEVEGRLNRFSLRDGLFVDAYMIALVR